ncbi:hypothetical protein NG799_09420 [Laspinema sp. D1]|uniref:Uncharacterized protein n=1 Tax=Laspinema palackyanum D2a TaxID=2953684 RepID=A0ABT2MP90_9CYAN|nr:hypothetical protein [Laspinema sp. D2b]MCT7966550.1 hypothetical protein [Laspinema sp. D2a]
MPHLFPEEPVGIEVGHSEGKPSPRTGESGWGEGESWEEKSASLNSKIKTAFKLDNNIQQLGLKRLIHKN